MRYSGTVLAMFTPWSSAERSGTSTPLLAHAAASQLLHDYFDTTSSLLHPIGAGLPTRNGRFPDHTNSKLTQGWQLKRVPIDVLDIYAFCKEMENVVPVVSRNARCGYRRISFASARNLIPAVPRVLIRVIAVPVNPSVVYAPANKKNTVPGNDRIYRNVSERPAWNLGPLTRALTRACSLGSSCQLSMG